MSAACLLRVRDLRVEIASHRGRLAPVDGISFDLAAGSVLGLVGESGAGKSMTGAAIIGLLDPPARITEGSIEFKGRRLDNLTERQLQRVRGRQIGMVFQDPLTSLDPLYTIGNQLIETLRVHSDLTHRQARSRAIDLLAEVGISEPASRIDIYPHQLSGGMRQRVVIALAVAPDPSLVIADEPTTSLDVSTQAQILALLSRMVSERRAAMILISHDMGVIAQNTDSVAVMYAGRAVEMGPTKTVIRSPKHPYTTALMASIPTLKSTASRLEQISGGMPPLDALPGGCAFHPRCVHAFQRCKTNAPILAKEGEIELACWLARC